MESNSCAVGSRHPSGQAVWASSQVTEQLYEIFPIGVPLVMQVLSLLFCLLQAIVFTMLLSIYISEGLEEE